MVINNITQTISTIPEAAHRGVDVQTVFVIKQEDFQDHLQGTTVTELNTLKDQLNSRIGEINSTVTTMNGYADTASAGASTATTKAEEASTSASGALTSRNQAETFKNNASASATKASQWAENDFNVEVETGRYSAKHWASKAAEIVSAGLIDDVTPSTSTVFSSTRSNNTYEPKNSNIQGHISNNTTNPHNVTKNQVGLSNVDNTSDVNKPISTATSTALNSKQNTLISGTNIKTINNNSILGSGNLDIGGTPAGTIITFAATTAPAGYLKCNGALLSRTTYADLFAAIGTTFGIGDGSTTFALPDMRGYFPRGFDDARGIDTGRVFGSSQADGYLNHSHTASETSAGAHTHTFPLYYPDTPDINYVGSGDSSRSTGTATTSSAGAHTHTITVNASTTGTTETRPKNIALLYCIKY